MWSRRGLILSVGATLSACGFTPVYGPTGEGQALRGAIRPAGPETELTFAFVRQFEERLGRANEPRYSLGYVIALDEVGRAIDGSNNITRYTIEGIIDWTLTPRGATSTVLSGRETGFTAYSASGSTVSTLESERDARRRLAVLLADKVVTRLLAEAPTLAR
ncbi:LPS assembly lipoprotein LptE [Jannaschia rubra]|uniref:LPS-assembly lipoprotein n=1 Tax=Jannaschia rubra TaxID=282197 RepID=A0A0M6XN20_9RHOB|nr:LPS assembly lipoprotein LptE [Jannaschia rubra]CTQ32546.1 hypothetical protein JAN5088_01317 [Jannaschia rubra]SFF84621.1 LPS-assembly lipoprotein [Jannaschia rubra]